MDSIDMGDWEMKINNELAFYNTNSRTATSKSQLGCHHQQQHSSSINK